MLARMQGEKNLHTLLVRMYASTNTEENSMEAPWKLQIDLPYNPAIHS
jgi:hypothetical protein